MQTNALANNERWVENINREPLIPGVGDWATFPSILDNQTDEKKYTYTV